jgi:uncharacterized coiled-coil DUF342 family protein
MTVDSLSELENKRMVIKKDLDESRKRREDLRQEMDRFADERDVLNNKVKELIKQLKEMKSVKDELSNKANELKQRKDKLSEEFRKELNERKTLRLAILRDKGKQVDIRKLKKERDDLIKRQMTGVYNKKEEEEIVKRIHTINKLIEDYEKESEKIALNDENYKKLDESIRQ